MVTDISNSESMIADFIVNAKVSPEVRQTTRRYLLDWMGSALAGSSKIPAQSINNVINQLGGKPHSTILSDGTKTSPTFAAFSNAASSHILEMDDVDMGSIFHPAAPIIPACLAVGEMLDTDGTQLLDAIAIGYEVGIRVGEALGTTHYEKWHTTGTAGTFGAAAATSRLLGLSTQETLSAIGSAGTMTAGLWEFLADGAMSKQLHPAKAAHDGILAALLAQQKFTSASKILTGKKGLIAAMSKSPSIDQLCNNLSSTMQVWKISNVAFKIHASCFHTHSAVDAALHISQTYSFDITEIEKIEVQIYSQALDLLQGVNPTTPYAAKFSLPFCIATALIHGDLSLVRFTEEALKDSQTTQLLESITFRPDSQLDNAYPIDWPSIVKVFLKNGEVLEHKIDYPIGDARTNVSNQVLQEKFCSMTQEIDSLDSLNFSSKILLQTPPLSPNEIFSELNLNSFKQINTVGSV